METDLWQALFRYEISPRITGLVSSPGDLLAGGPLGRPPLSRGLARLPALPSRGGGRFRGDRARHSYFVSAGAPAGVGTLALAGLRGLAVSA